MVKVYIIIKINSFPAFVPLCSILLFNNREFSGRNGVGTADVTTEESGIILVHLRFGILLFTRSVLAAEYGGTTGIASYGTYSERSRRCRIEEYVDHGRIRFL